jgi:NADH-quinone oxidoreductase subunit L
MPPEAIQLGRTLGTLLTLAWLLPLGGFAVEIFGGYLWSRKSRAAAYLAVLCIGTGFVLSAAALVHWGTTTGWSVLKADEHGGGHETAAGHGAAAGPARHDDQAPEHSAEPSTEKQKAESPEQKVDWPKSFSGTLYTLAEFGSLRLAVDYHIDSLTLVMFTMVTLIASLIHIFAIGYMSDELTDDHEDHQVHTSHGHLHRPGRFYRFFAFMSLFSFSMLGLVLAGNIFMVFIFWELVGVCSYFLIGFYTERKSASTAANKAFIMNRVGDFGFLIGMMILWTYFGTFQFTTRVENGQTRAGLFDMLR